jgi:hypothetical protein
MIPRVAVEEGEEDTPGCQVDNLVDAWEGKGVFRAVFVEILSHPIYKNINRAIIYAPGSSHAYTTESSRYHNTCLEIKAYKL